MRTARCVSHSVQAFQGPELLTFRKWVPLIVLHRVSSPREKRRSLTDIGGMPDPAVKRASVTRPTKTTKLVRRCCQRAS